MYFASYFREDCVFRFIFQTILYILLPIADKIVYFASYFRQDYFNLLHISDRIVYFASYFRQDCIFGVCPVNFNCDAGYPYCH